MNDTEFNVTSAFDIARGLTKIQPKITVYPDSTRIPAYKMAIIGLGMEGGISLTRAMMETQMNRHTDVDWSGVQQFIDDAFETAKDAISNLSVYAEQKIAEIKESEFEREGEGIVECLLNEYEDDTFGLEIYGLEIVDDMREVPSAEMRRALARAYTNGMSRGAAMVIKDEIGVELSHEEFMKHIEEANPNEG
jgi:hypothetical protein